jgi:hypothetical protein
MLQHVVLPGQNMCGFCQRDKKTCGASPVIIGEQVDGGSYVMKCSHGVPLVEPGEAEAQDQPRGAQGMMDDISYIAGEVETTQALLSRLIYEQQVTNTLLGGILTCLLVTEPNRPTHIDVAARNGLGAVEAVERLLEGKQSN